MNEEVKSLYEPEDHRAGCEIVSPSKQATPKQFSPTWLSKHELNNYNKHAGGGWGKAHEA